MQHSLLRKEFPNAETRVPCERERNRRVLGHGASCPFLCPTKEPAVPTDACRVQASSPSRGAVAAQNSILGAEP